MVAHGENRPLAAIVAEQPIIVGKVKPALAVLGSVPILGAGLIGLPRVIPDWRRTDIDTLGYCLLHPKSGYQQEVTGIANQYHP